jgi:hypothetical protein
MTGVTVTRRVLLRLIDDRRDGVALRLAALAQRPA